MDEKIKALEEKKEAETKQVVEDLTPKEGRTGKIKENNQCIN